MKRLIIKIFVFCLPLVCSLPLIVFCVQRSYHNIDWRLPKEKHILFMGASHIVQGIDDSLTPNAINLSKESERYMFTYIKLERILENNHQIDTVFLECAPTDIFEHADDKYFNDSEMAFFFTRYYPFFKFKQWCYYRNNSLAAFQNLYSPNNIRSLFQINDYTSFVSSFPEHKGQLNRDLIVYDPFGGVYGHEINYLYLRKIIDLCNNMSIKLYFLYCPMFRPEYYYDQDYYYSALKQYFGEVELLDYSQFPMEDDEREDAHHLNDKGAQRFTWVIKERFGF